jgi:hypothetical protein
VRPKGREGMPENFLRHGRRPGVRAHQRRRSVVGVSNADCVVYTATRPPPDLRPFEGDRRFCVGSWRRGTNVVSSSVGAARASEVVSSRRSANPTRGGRAGKGSRRSSLRGSILGVFANDSAAARAVRALVGRWDVIQQSQCDLQLRRTLRSAEQVLVFETMGGSAKPMDIDAVAPVARHPRVRVGQEHRPAPRPSASGSSSEEVNVQVFERLPAVRAVPIGSRTVELGSIGRASASKVQGISSGG